MVGEETKKSQEGNPAGESQVGKMALFCVIWRVATNGKLLLPLPRNSGESCVGFKVARLVSAEVSVNQCLTGLSTREA